MESFLRYASGSAKRIGVLSWPSQLALNSIRKLWLNNHSVFPILPTRTHRLIHLLTESRCDFLLVHPDMPDVSHIKDNLGIPIVPMTDTQPQLDEISANRTILFESRAHSSIPVVGETKWSPSSLLPQGSVLPFSCNWVFDAQSSRAVFPDTFRPVSPNTLIVDVSTIDSLISNRDNGLVDTSSVHSVIVDMVSRDSDAVGLNMKQLREKLDLLASGSELFARLVVPETQLAELVPLGSEFDARAVDMPKDFSFIGRAKSASDVKLHFDVLETPETAVSRRERMKKKRIMQADWRIRQVPIAVYHKKRGFKGQIYYTTKHKGWTFYKSRY
jgi:hypothetical protein